MITFTFLRPARCLWNPFEVSFKFDSPFVYDPTQGHLYLYLAHQGPTLLTDRSVDAHIFGALHSTVPLASVGGGIVGPDRRIRVGICAGAGYVDTLHIRHRGTF